MPTSDSRLEFRSDALSIIGLSSFAVAQPLFDLLGRNEQFFVAHRLEGAGIVAFALAVAFGLPALLVAVEFVVRRIAPRAQRALHLFMVFGLLALMVAPLANRGLALPSRAIVAGVLVAAVLGTVAYARIAGARRFAGVLAIGAPIFPVLFLFASEVSSLVLPQSTAGLFASSMKQAAPRKPAPIVFIVFDEFETGALLDETGAIDPVRYPNFAALAKDSWWFPRATTVWAETKKAVPAILTGMRPTAASQLTYQTHPNNLFTWLDPAYRLNVTETVTGLCPPTACNSAAHRPFRPPEFASDLGVILLHMVLPPTVAAKHLPPMDAGWAGFGSAVAQDTMKKAFTDNARKSVFGDRRGQFRTFVQGVEGGQTLNFLHMILPHNPQAYLPKGSLYLGWEIEGLTKSVWSEDPQFAALGYQRYMLQLGFVDTLLGELFERMKKMGIYDEALIVVTADHGRSFIPGQRTRATAPRNDEQASELFKVPLFIKRPGQREGHRSERYVHTIDILPTVADVIGADMPWKADGVSVFSPSFPERTTLQLEPMEGVPDGRTFDLKTITSYPRLPWKHATFGSRTPLDRLAIASPYESYVGRSTASIMPTTEGEGMTAELGQAAQFGDVDLASGLVPALLRGEIHGVPQGTEPVNVAIGLNGQIVAVTRTSAWARKPFYFAAMLPESAFKAGRNQIELFRLHTIDGRDVIAPIALEDQDPLRLELHAGSEVLVSQKGKKTVVRADAVIGHGELTVPRIGLFRLAGWAANRQTMSPAETIVVFANDRQIYSGGTGLDQPQLVTSHQAPPVAKAGFQFRIESRAIRPGEKLRAFAIAHDGSAGEIAIEDRVADGVTLP